MTTTCELGGYLTELHLPTVRGCFQQEADNARRDSLSYEKYLQQVMERELEDRRSRRRERLLKESHLPLEKTVQAFDRTRLTQKVNTQYSVLLEGDFVARRENVLAFGNPGSGKTHLLCALSYELICRGHRVLFTTGTLLVQELLHAKQQLRLIGSLKRFKKYDAVMIDDLGYVQHSREEMEVLFTFLSERYERGSVMLTSNLPFSKWESIFKDPMTTAAAIDRLVHHCIIIELNLPSYRLEHSKKTKPVTLTTKEKSQTKKSEGVPQTSA
jgi:DNA replication protein DnaC